MSYYLYAETAFHHEGDEAYLGELIRAVAGTGVQGIKFQVLLNVDEFVSSRHRAYESIRQWVFSLEQWRRLFRLALEQRLEIIMMPLDTAAFRLAEEFPVARLDLHSVSFHDPAMLQGLNTAGKPIILGVGGRTQAEVEDKVDYFHDKLLTLMAGFQAFPSDLRDVRLSRVAFLKEHYPAQTIGYADHTSYDDPYTITSLEYAFLLGARVFEKHVTLDEGEKRVDYEAAVGIDKLADIKGRLDYLESLLSTSSEEALTMSPAEIRYRERQKFAVARRALAAGHVLGDGDLVLKITDEAQGLADCEQLIGRRLKREVGRDEVITGDVVK